MAWPSSGSSRELAAHFAVNPSLGPTPCSGRKNKRAWVQSSCCCDLGYLMLGLLDASVSPSSEWTIVVMRLK